MQHSRPRNRWGGIAPSGAGDRRPQLLVVSLLPFPAAVVVAFLARAFLTAAFLTAACEVLVSAAFLTVEAFRVALALAAARGVTVSVAVRPLTFFRAWVTVS